MPGPSYNVLPDGKTGWTDTNAFSATRPNVDANTAQVSPNANTCKANSHPKPDSSSSFKFAQAGTFAYHCMFHPYMVASVVVK